MKIAQVIIRFHPAIGGAETHALELSKELVKRGHEVTVHTSNLLSEHPWKKLKKTPREVAGVKIKRHNILKLPIYPIMPGLTRELRKNDYDVIHSHAMPRSYTDQAAKAKRKLVITTHGLHLHENPKNTGLLRKGISKTFIKTYYNTLGKRTLRKAHKVICISKQEKEYLEDYADKDKLVVIGNGIHYDKYKGRTRKGTKLLFIGRIDKGKGLQHLIKALKGTNEELEIIGSDYGYKEELKEQIKKLGIEAQVSFKGRVTEKEKIRTLQQCKALVLPSKYESFGIVLLEAMACNKPVIATRTGGVPGLVSKKEGILTPYGDVRALKNAIRKIKDFKSQGRKKAKKYDWKKITKKVIKQYY